MKNVIEQFEKKRIEKLTENSIHGQFNFTFGQFNLLLGSSTYFWAVQLTFGPIMFSHYRAPCVRIGPRTITHFHKPS